MHSETSDKGVALEHDGSVYACDHCVHPEFRLGREHGRALRDIVFPRQGVRFSHAGSESLPGCCAPRSHFAATFVGSITGLPGVRD